MTLPSTGYSLLLESGECPLEIKATRQILNPQPIVGHQP